MSVKAIEHTVAHSAIRYVEISGFTWTNKVVTLASLAITSTHTAHDNHSRRRSTSYGGNSQSSKPSALSDNG